MLKEKVNNKKNVLGGTLVACCYKPRTGYFRDGYCRTDHSDLGSHVICAEMTSEFLEFTKGRGNDLSTPQPLFGFPGLRSGDRWCLCAIRWKEALEMGLAPPVILEACEESALKFTTIEALQENAVKAVN